MLRFMEFLPNIVPDFEFRRLGYSEAEIGYAFEVRKRELARGPRHRLSNILDSLSRPSSMPRRFTPRAIEENRALFSDSSRNALSCEIQYLDF